MKSGGRDTDTEYSLALALALGETLVGCHAFGRWKTKTMQYKQARNYPPNITNKYTTLIPLIY